MKTPIGFSRMKAAVVSALAVAAAAFGVHAGDVTVESDKELEVSAASAEAVNYTVEGKLIFSGNANTELNKAGSSVVVKNGGVFNVNCNEGENYGNYQGFFIDSAAFVLVEAGGLLDILKNGCIGSGAEGLIHLDGGTLHAHASAPNNKGYIRNMKLSNGARITGGSIGAAWCQESWSDRNAKHATMVVDGTSPSFIDTTYLTIGGGRNGTYASVIANNGKVIGEMALDLTVNDVTGNAASDLVVNALVTTWADFADWPSNKLYLAKTGAGTLELAGGVQGLPGLRLGEGTVLVGKTGNTLGALTVTGNSTLAIADGAEITIGALVLEGGTLTLDAELKDCVVNLGTTDEAVLDAIVYQGKTEALAIQDGRLVSTLVSEAPVMGDFSVSVVDIITADFTVDIVEFGEGQDSADLYVAIGTDPSALGAFELIGEGETGVNSVSGYVTVPEESVTYYYAIKLKNDAGYFSGKVKTGSFRAAPPMTTLTSAVCYSGLLQGKINNANDFETDILAGSVIPLEVVPGVMMALYKVDSGAEGRVFYTSPYTWNEFKWNGSNTTYGYYGDIYLNAGDVLNIGKNIDDSALVKIGGEEILKNTTWDAYPVETFTAPETGWYPLEVRLGDGNGGKGVTSADKFGGIGLAYNIGGTTNPDESGWALLADAAHDGSFLRYCDRSVSHLQMASLTVEDDDVVVWLGVTGKVGAGAKLMAYYGAADCGETVSAWPYSSEIATVGAGGLPATKYRLPGLAKFGAIRFALVVPGSETVQGLVQFSPVTEFAQIDPVITFDFAGEVQAESAPVSVNVAALGFGATAATIYAEVSLDGTFEDAVRTKLGEVTVASVFEANVTGLTKATAYSVRLVIETDAGGSVTTEPKSFTTFDPDVAHAGDTLTWAGGELGSWNTTDKNWTLTINGEDSAVAWVDGCKARIPDSTMLTLAGDRSVIGIESLGDVTIAGDATLTLQESRIVAHVDGKMRFECPIQSAAGIVIEPSGYSYLPMGEENKIRIVEGGSISDIRDLSVMCRHRAPNNNTERIDNLGMIADDQAVPGISYVKASDDRVTFECRVKSDSYNDPYIAKVVLLQVGSDIWGYVEAAKRYAYRAFNASIDDETAGGYVYDIDLVTGPIEKADRHAIAIQHVALMLDGPAAANATVGFAGPVVAPGLTFADCSVAIMETGSLGADGTYGGTLTVNGTLLFGGTATQRLTGTLTGRDDAQVIVLAGADVVLENEKSKPKMFVYGTVTMKSVNALQKDAVVEVMDGGLVVLDSNGNYAGGVSGSVSNYLKVNAGGRLVTVREALLGSDRRIWLDGGVYSNAIEYAGGQIPTSYANSPRYLDLLNGGRVEGKFFGVGGESWGPLYATVNVSGTSPSWIASEVMRLGYATPTSDRECGAAFNVEDVTGDAAADLIITAELVQVPNMATSQWYDLTKTGAGTIELRNRVAYSATTIVSEGTIRLGAGGVFEAGVSSEAAGCGPSAVVLGNGTLDLGASAGNVFGSLTVNGEATLMVGTGASATFADSSAVAWAEDATLNLVGDISGLCFGANGLTDAQLAAIRINGKPANVRLTSDGHLSKAGFQLIIR